MQKYTSENTSIKQIPYGVKIVDKYFGWMPNTINFDIGGGKYNLMSNYLISKGVTNYVYDPYNRSEEHNLNVLNVCCNGQSDTVTIFNVLNVIMEREIQIRLLKLADNALKYNGFLYVRSTYKNPNKISGVTKSGSYQHYLTHVDYLEIVKEIFPNACLKHDIIFVKKERS